ncbi:MAG: class I SAM-dependent methyltransferase [Clostridioides sp.]|jgi:tRNA A58 N-methylase Trm61|nr:class I SAM-dependent methyltransferase [Clostridioides sp.]
MSFNYLTKITDINKIFLDKFLKEGSTVIDATMGNGYDTKYLAEKVGETGFVYAFDIQDVAIKNTTKLLEKYNLKNNTKLINDSHENILEYHTGNVDCIMFNLGYLPSGDHNLITKPDSTINALKDSLKILNKNGIISITIYSGHKGGQEEKEAVLEFVQSLPQTDYSVFMSKFINQINNPPELILIEKR